MADRIHGKKIPAPSAAGDRRVRIFF